MPSKVTALPAPAGEDQEPPAPFPYPIASTHQGGCAMHRRCSANQANPETSLGSIRLNEKMKTAKSKTLVYTHPSFPPSSLSFPNSSPFCPSCLVVAARKSLPRCCSLSRCRLL